MDRAHSYCNTNLLGVKALQLFTILPCVCLVPPNHLLWENTFNVQNQFLERKG